jgi:hypothetical protein
MLNVSKNIKELLTKNDDGVYEWKDRDVWNPIFKQYFERRQEDDLSEIELQEKTNKTS